MAKMSGCNPDDTSSNLVRVSEEEKEELRDIFFVSDKCANGIEDWSWELHRLLAKVIQRYQCEAITAKKKADTLLRMLEGERISYEAEIKKLRKN